VTLRLMMGFTIADCDPSTTLRQRELSRVDRDVENDGERRPIVRTAERAIAHVVEALHCDVRAVDA